MILLIDNYDSFVYNLARYVTNLGFETLVQRNDKISLDDIEILSPSHIILSPGPSIPDNAGVMWVKQWRGSDSNPLILLSFDRGLASNAHQQQVDRTNDR